MRFVAGRGAVLEKLAGALMRMAGVFLAEMQLAGAHHCVMVLRAAA